jgi:hypothetical protein
VLGLATDVYAPDASPPPNVPGSTAQQNTRYAYLVGRLRTRQITMEEATELFGLMQGMLRTSEQARLIAQRAATSASPAPLPGPGAAAPRTPPSAVSGTSDDLFLVGLLAMGAGAGLMAAMAKRLQDMTPPPAPDSRGRTASGSTSR